MDVNNPKLRKKLMELYGLDINDSKSFFSVRNHAFLFPNQPHMLRINISGNRTREEMLSETFWLDDLQQFSSTICAPAPSLAGHLLEEFEIDGQTYHVSLFCAAKGNIRMPNDLDPMYFIAVGDCLGRIHAASTDASQHGFKFKRKHWTQQHIGGFDAPESGCSPELYARMSKVVEQIKAIPEDPRWFGMIHGDFCNVNFLVDGNNVWPFDFDECCYCYFMYDIVALISFWLVFGYPIEGDKTRRQTFYEDILPYFRTGYELHVKFPEEHWNNLDLFLDYRICVAAYQIRDVQAVGVTADVKKMQRVMAQLIACPNIWDGLDLWIQLTGTAPEDMGFDFSDAMPT